MSKDKGILSRIQGLFSKRVNPEQVRLGLRKNLREVEDELSRLKREQGKLRIERDKAIKKGVRASTNGDTATKAEAAMELRLARAELAELVNTHAMLVKTRLVVRTMIRKLGLVSREGALGVTNKIREILTDPKLDDLVTNSEVKLEDLSDWLTERTNAIIDESERRHVADEDLIGAEGILFDQLAEAIEGGDSEGAARINSRLTGEAPLKNDFFEDEDL